MAFTQSVCGQNELIAVDELKDGEIKTLWSEYEGPSSIQINDVAGCCAVVMTLPPLNPTVSQYGIQQLNRFPDAPVFSQEQSSMSI